MYTFLIQNDNRVIATERQRIMQCSKLVDVLQIIVPKFYNGLEMANYSARLEYLTPINHKYNYVELEIADANYKTDYLLYKIPIDINLTSEVGDSHDLSKMINNLSTDTATPTDKDYYVSQYSGGETTNTNYFRRPMSALWSYIKNKLKTVAITGSYNDLSNKPGTGTSSAAGLTKLYTNTGTATDGAMTQAATKTALDGKASSSHTHNYAGSSSAGGVANSANKLATPRKINGIAFDGTRDINNVIYTTKKRIRCTCKSRDI